MDCMAVPQVGSNGTNVRAQTVQYGNCLGGGSSVNTMVGSRPTLAGMNAVEALGNPGWGWDDFLPMMQRSETFTPPNAQQMALGASFNASVHGTSGPVGVSFPNPMLAPQVQNAAKNTTENIYGVTLTQDMGSGFSGGEFIELEQRRSSSAWSFLYPESQQRPNLTVLTQHTVNIITTTNSSNGGNITATGVTLIPTSGGDPLTFSVTREVIVSAGAPFSPGVLQRSGIGNATLKVRTREDIDLSKKAEAGNSFQDQILLNNISFPIADALKSNPNVTLNATMLGVVVAHATANNAFGNQGTQMIFSAIRNSNSVADQLVSSGSLVNAQSMALQVNVTANAYEIDHPLIELFFTPAGTLSIWTQTTLPMSRGTVRINTTNPLAFPVVDAQYLTVDADIQIMTRAARRLGLAASTPPFSNLLTDTAYAESGLPAVNASDDAWRTWALDRYSPGVHFVGSNSMMPQEMGGVVSPQLLVYGTSNLRVADASIMPLSVFPHCTLGLYGVAEKAADMILETASTTDPMPVPSPTSPSSSSSSSASASPTSPSGSTSNAATSINRNAAAAGIAGAVLVAFSLHIDSESSIGSDTGLICSILFPRLSTDLGFLCAVHELLDFERSMNLKIPGRQQAPGNKRPLLPALYTVTWLQWAQFASGLLAWTCDALDFYSVSLSVTAFSAKFDKNTHDITTAITLSLLLRTAGAIIFGILSDRYGRKWPMVANLLLVTVLEISTSFVNTYSQFLAVRSLFGIGMGGIWGLAAATALENLPVETRGLASGILQQGYALGCLLASILNLTLVPAKTEALGKDTWKTMFWLAGGLSFFTAAFRAVLPESALFIRARRDSEGRGISARARTEIFVREGRKMMKLHWGRFIYAFLLMAGELPNTYKYDWNTNLFVGFTFLAHGSQDLYPTFLRQTKGFSEHDSTMSTVIGFCGAIVGGTISGWISQYIGRRLTIMLYMILIGAFIPLWILPKSFAALTAGAFFMQFATQGSTGVIPIQLSEVSPPAFRASFPGIAYQLGSMVSSASAQIEATGGDNIRLPTTLPDGTTSSVPDYGTVQGILIGVVAAFLFIVTLLGPENHGNEFDKHRAAFEEGGGEDGAYLDNDTATPTSEGNLGSSKEGNDLEKDLVDEERIEEIVAG
ncbi:hypothetical protein D9758_011326 [Tetrapyrgos nigripes]|uniref:Major facilitator superfamily (MFS) profile domain-containing protein n=1 Tax=Tetrapyrgos nigripes TaxID=182062 RepID=A0A8H5G876_9AGAR|nr:hypothetical protein D9758_011326 [Tetrapyrgos nigripes]